MQLIQQIDTMRERAASPDKYEDMAVYISVMLFLSMTTVLLVILSL